MSFSLDNLKDIAPSVQAALRGAGARVLFVGGCVRDALRGVAVKDFDLEIYGLSLDQLEATLESVGTVLKVGRSFGVFKLKQYPHLDIALPRRESKTGQGHKGFMVTPDSTLSFEEAALRRDLTLNSMGYDPVTGELLDPYHGQEDLKAQRLHPTSMIHFGEDPLRALRVMQFAARFEMMPSSELLDLCAAQPLEELSVERVGQEFDKLLLQAARPSIGLRFLKDAALTRYFPELQNVNEQWVDHAAALRRTDDEEAGILMYAALCLQGRAETLLPRLGKSGRLQAHVTSLVSLYKEVLKLSKASPLKSFRTLARQLMAHGVSVDLLIALLKATGVNPFEEQFHEAMAEGLLLPKVTGDDLIKLGLLPGPNFKKILDLCLDQQDEAPTLSAEEMLESVRCARPELF